MSHVFAPGVSACLADGRLVILNVRADRYLMAPRAVEASLLRLVRGEKDAPGDTALRDRLCTDSLVLRRASGPPPALCSMEPPVRSLLDDGWDGCGHGRVAIAAARMLATMAELRLRGLTPPLQRLGRRRPRADDEAAAARIAAAFAELRLAIRPLDRCLPHSVALALAARRHQADVRLVLGVRCYPFAAHAWVQCGSALLNDRLDTVHAYTPILVQ
jgi:hypothetical protein